MVPARRPGGLRQWAPARTDGAPMSAAVHDSLAPWVDLDALTHESSAADAAVLNDLADAAPSDAVVPAFDASGVRWDIDVRTYANHPRVRYYLDYFQGPARSRMEIFLEPRSPVRDAHPLPLPGRGPPGRPRLSGADRERLLERGREPGLRRRDVAVHARHRERLRPPGGLLGGRAPRPGQGHRRGRPPSAATCASGSARSISPRRRTTPGPARSRGASEARVGHARGVRDPDEASTATRPTKRARKPNPTRASRRLRGRPDLAAADSTSPDSAGSSTPTR